MDGGAVRADIAKVICERPRTGGDAYGSRHRAERLRSRQRSRQLRFVWSTDEHGEADELSLDELTPVKQSMSRHAKELSDFLSPLKGWLAKQVGRLWAEVHSELCAHLGGNGVMQQHVRGHADDYLLAPDKVRIVDGVAHEAMRFTYGAGGMTREIEDDTLYGDPRDGIIKWGTRPTRDRYGLRRYNPAAQQRVYRPLPRTNGAEVDVYDAAGEYTGTLRRRENQWWFAWWEWQVAHVKWQGLNSWPVYDWVARERSPLTPRDLKKLGYRPEKKRRR